MIGLAGLLVLPFSAAAAARQKSGLVPVQEPLQPPPANVKPNVNNNVFYNTGESDANLPAQDLQNNSDNANFPADQQDSPPLKEAALNTKSPSRPSGRTAWWIAGILGVAALGGIFVWRKRYGGKQ